MDETKDMGEFDFEELDTTVVLNDEDGNEVVFEFLDLIEYENSDYVVLLPEDDTDGEVVILKLEMDEEADMETYSAVEDEDTLTAIFEIFRERFANNFTTEE